MLSKFSTRFSLPVNLIYLHLTTHCKPPIILSNGLKAVTDFGVTMNPIITARSLSLLSTTALSRQLGVSRQYISRLEQGLYDKPSEKVLEWAVATINKNRSDPITVKALTQLYSEWQWQKRESARMDLILRPLEVSEFDRMRMPDRIFYHKIFKNWRSDYWPTAHAFCVSMCVHPSPVANYEDGQTITMPKTLVQVLSQMNLIGDNFRTAAR